MAARANCRIDLRLAVRDAVRTLKRLALSKNRSVTEPLLAVGIVFEHTRRAPLEVAMQGPLRFMAACSAHRPSMKFVDKAPASSLAKRALVLGSFAALTACGSMQKKPAQPTSSAPPAASTVAPAVVSLEEWMARGEAAIKNGNHMAARDAWRAATKSYPTAKQPWLKLSEDYFNAADYGNAVLAAQEALQRDPKDRMAHSVLAVSGLRLTAGSLTALREDGTFSAAVGSREEAVAVTRSLREALGEPVLVPPPEPASAPAHKRPARAPVRAAAAASGNQGAPTTTTPPSDNPLDKLK